MSFITFLISSSVIVAATVIVILLLTFRDLRNRLVTFTISVDPNILVLIHISILTAFIITSILSFQYEHRSIFYFVFQTALFGSGILILLTKRYTHTNNLMILTILIIVVLNILTTRGNNDFLPLGADEPRDILVANNIIVNEDIEKARDVLRAFSTYYLLIPALPIDISVLALITGIQTFKLLFIIGIAAALTFVFSMYIALQRLTNNSIIPWISIFIILSTPRLTFIEIIPQTLSLALIAVTTLLLINYIKNRRITVVDISLFALLLFGSVIYHVVGPVILITLSMITIALTVLLIRSNTISRKITALSMIAIIIPLAHWVYNEAALASIGISGSIFLKTFSVETTDVQLWAPYLGEEFDIYGISWGVPYGISFAYAVVYIIHYFRRYNHLIGLEYYIAFLASLVGISLPFIAFISFISSPQAGVERYITTAAYFVLVISSSICIGFLIKHSRNYIAIGLIALLMINIYIGSQSPEFAPLENRTFEALRYSKDSIQIEDLAYAFKDRSFIYSDNDVLPFDRLKSSELKFGYTISYKVIRTVIQNFTDGRLDTFKVIRAPENIFIIKSERFSDDIPLYPEVNLVSSGGRYYIFIIERG
ncbi:MAG: hypothetical protein KatS3mg003_1180 [Candidatus Nitrosocaldaceae archaeon]|nr:MAG: hypothetical protein KatS3mg003_1180 [Candidatus Nitrosocaldaceae archaeon]